MTVEGSKGSAEGSVGVQGAWLVKRGRGAAAAQRGDATGKKTVEEVSLPGHQQCHNMPLTLKARVGGISGHLRAQPPGQQLGIHYPAARPHCRRICRCRCCYRGAAAAACRLPRRCRPGVARVCHGEHVAVPHRCLVQADASAAQQRRVGWGRTHPLVGAAASPATLAFDRPAGVTAGCGPLRSLAPVLPPHLSRMWSQQ